MKLNIFFYGLFMDPDILRANGLSPSLHKIDTLQNYKLILSHRATLKKTSNECVWGTVMQLTKMEIEKLYSSPSVADYRSTEITLQSGTKSHVYILPEDMTLIRPENSDYAINLKNIALKLSLPNSYIQKLDQIIRMIDEGSYSC